MEALVSEMCQYIPGKAIDDHETEIIGVGSESPNSWL